METMVTSGGTYIPNMKSCGQRNSETSLIIDEISMVRDLERLFEIANSTTGTDNQNP